LRTFHIFNVVTEEELEPTENVTEKGDAELIRADVMNRIKIK
jgi:hypothetical protein